MKENFEENKDPLFIFHLIIKYNKLDIDDDKINIFHKEYYKFVSKISEKNTDAENYL